MLAVPARPAFVEPLATLPVYWTVTGRLLTEKYSWAEACEGVLATVRAPRVQVIGQLAAGDWEVVRRHTRGAMRPADMRTTLVRDVADHAHVVGDKQDDGAAPVQP